MRVLKLPLVAGFPLWLGACATAIPGVYTEPKAGFAKVSTDTSAAIGKIKKALKSLDLKEFLSGPKDCGKALLPALKDLAKSPVLIASLGAAAAWKAAGVVAGAAWRLAWSGAARLTSAITGMISALAGAAWRTTASAAGATFSAAWRAAASAGSAITSMITALAGAAWRATGLIAGAAFSAGFRVASVVGSAVTRMITALASAAWAVTGTAAGAAFSAAARTAMVLGSAVTRMIAALGGAAWLADRRQGGGIVQDRLQDPSSAVWRWRIAHNRAGHVLDRKDWWQGAGVGADCHGLCRPWSVAGYPAYRAGHRGL